MKPRLLVLALFAPLLAFLVPSAGVAQEAASAWPPITRSAKPWTRWWWPGSAVDRANLTRQLEAIAAAGIGGVEITPIYGARGSEARYVDFLSPRWMEMLEHTTREAKRLGLGVDMASGTGWPFGGPTVGEADGSSSLVLLDGKLTGKQTSMKVKRPAPGGEGLVLDPYSTAALDRYLRPFSKAFAGFPRDGLRAQFHDSFEYYQASWTATLPEVFQKMHGYDIQAHAAQFGEAPVDEDTRARIKGDYRRTLAKLHLDYVNAWVTWAHEEGFKARNQAHGAPGNLLDLYGVADIPETESFGLTQLPIVGLRGDAVGVSIDPDPPEVTIGRFASSAAHVMGRPLVSSETLTWLRENFRESPAAAKPQLDRLFAAGINHIFYHGTVYSPAEAEWPGWFFYASTQLTPANPLWDDFGAMHAYVARVQSVLQAGAPDNDILLYWPFDDVVEHGAGLMEHYGVHENKWLTEAAAGRMAASLLQAGFAFDFISDAQLAKLNVDGRTFIAPGGGRYRAIVVPTTRRMSVESLAHLRNLAKRTGRVVIESLPQDVPGLARLEERRKELRELLVAPVLNLAVAGEQITPALLKHGVRQEQAPEAGLLHIRRASTDGHDYFFANLGAKAFDGWLQLGVSAASAMLLDPLTGRAGKAAVKRGGDGKLQVYLQIASGQSALVRTSRANRSPSAQPWRYEKAAEAGVALQGDWQLEFVSGGPVLPGPARMSALSSWTALDDAEAKRFAGTARYRVEFDAPAKAAESWALDLGDVRETARVTLNGKPLDTAWSLPFRIRLDGLKPRGNELLIEVTNLPANRIRDLDARKVPWKVMRDINIASVKYRPFDAAAWEIEPAGLLGPVTLVPLAIVRP
ncbi:MAG TPA: glycosyl hydrolase [Steroidobacteraceae bacterium]|nr:glycosyl hydrolase [Steroidobacteraceae bacterium]